MGFMPQHIIFTEEEERFSDEILDELAPIAEASARAASAAEEAGLPKWAVMAAAREAANAAAAAMEQAERRRKREQHNSRRARRSQEEGA